MRQEKTSVASQKSMVLYKSQEVSEAIKKGILTSFFVLSSLNLYPNNKQMPQLLTWMLTHKMGVREHNGFKYYEMHLGGPPSPL